MTNKQHIQSAIDALKKVPNDDFITDIVRELEGHAETLEDDTEDDSGGNHPKDPRGKP